jgi:hypothetical protein
MRVGIVVLVVAVSVAPAVRAQHLTLYGGETRYDVGQSAANTSWLGGVALGRALTAFLRTDVTVLAFGYEGGSFVDGWSVAGTRMATEVGFYLQPRAGWFRPYAGGGAGVSVSHRRLNGDPPRFGRVSETVHGAVGSDIGMSRAWGMRMEVRVRGIVGPGRTSDLTLGLSRRFARKR